MDTKDLAQEAVEIMILPWKERAIKAEADNAALVATINDVYPMIAGRTMDLMSAGEEKAAKHWNEASQKLYRATQDQHPGADLLKELEELRRARDAALKRQKAIQNSYDATHHNERAMCAAEMAEAERELDKALAEAGKEE